jgi:hypothetical protein
MHSAALSAAFISGTPPSASPTVEASMSALVAVPLLPALVSLSRPPQPTAPASASVETMSAERDIGLLPVDGGIMVGSPAV